MTEKKTGEIRRGDDGEQKLRETHTEYDRENEGDMRRGCDEEKEEGNGKRT